MAVAPATRRDVAAHGPSAGSGGGAEARAPYRRRRAHSHRPGLCSDKWGASCPDVWSRGPRASPRQRGSCLGRRRSDGGPGPTKPVQPLTPPRRGASPRTCDRPQSSSFPERRPLHNRHSREGGNPGWRRGGPPVHTTASDPAKPSRQRPPAHPPPTKPSRSDRRRSPTPTPSVRPSRFSDPRHVPGKEDYPMPAGGRRHGPAGGHAACPHQEQPPRRLSAEDTPWANRPSKGPRPQSIKGGPSNSLGKGALARKQLLFYPPASFKRRQKNTKQSYTGGLIIRHVCSPRPPSSSTPRPRNPPPLGRRASDRQRPPAT